MGLFDVVGDAWDGVTSVASDAWDGVTHVAGEAWDGVTSAAGWVGDRLGDAWGWIADHWKTIAAVAIGTVVFVAVATFAPELLPGLFALAREEVRGTPAVLGAVDEALAGMERHEFLIAAPALRLAFNFFPPREKLDIAKAVLGIHDSSEIDPRWLTKPEIAPEVAHAGMQIDAETDERAKRYGL